MARPATATAEAPARTAAEDRPRAARATKTDAEITAEKRAEREAEAAEFADKVAAARLAGRPAPKRERDNPEPSKTPKTYRASERGYTDGVLHEAGEVFSTTAPEGTWMIPVSGKQADLARAVDEGMQPRLDDVALEALDETVLQAVAVMKGINPRGLGKDQLLAAIRASYDRDRTQ